MQFLKSLVCWHGFDNRIRFSAIHSTCFIFLLTVLVIFPVTLAVLSLIVITVLYAFSIKRRINDAAINKSWPLISALLLALVGILVILFDNNITLMLFILPIAFSAFLATYKSEGNRKYISGYNGPIDLSSIMQKSTSRQHQSNRIEPVLSGNVDQAQYSNDKVTEQNSDASKTSASFRIPDKTTNVDLGESIQAWVIQYKFLVIGVLTFCLIAIFAILLMPMQTQQITENVASSAQTVEPTEIVRLHPVNLPDNFTLMLSQFNGVIINWQADNTVKASLWDITSAEGDNSCKEIRFNNGDKIRTTSVAVENGQDYFASFSPLDTTLMLKNIAFKGKFTLCDYTFSLKGSQAALGKHPIYAEIVEY